jgi:hypothetical protein
MVARSHPIGVKLKPDPSQDDAERLRQLREALQRHLTGAERHLNGAARVNAQIVKLEAKLKDAA